MSDNFLIDLYQALTDYPLPKAAPMHEICSEDYQKVLLLCVRANVPIHNVPGLQRYFCDHIAPGSFLTAVLCNDLKAACLTADETNRHHLYDLVSLFQMHAPPEAWGSYEKFNAWLEVRPDAAT